MQLYRPRGEAGRNLILAPSSAGLVDKPGTMRDQKAVADVRFRSSGREVDGWQDEGYGG